MTEIMLRDAGAADGLRYMMLRYFNVAGADAAHCDALAHLRAGRPFRHTQLRLRPWLFRTAGDRQREARVRRRF
jgi:UDP-glucose 4-epimerase